MGIFNKDILKEAIGHTLVLIIIMCVFGVLLFGLVKAVLMGSIFLLIIGIIVTAFLVLYGVCWVLHSNENNKKI